MQLIGLVQCFSISKPKLNPLAGFWTWSPSHQLFANAERKPVSPQLPFQLESRLFKIMVFNSKAGQGASHQSLWIPHPHLGLEHISHYPAQWGYGDCRACLAPHEVLQTPTALCQPSPIAPKWTSTHTCLKSAICAKAEVCMSQFALS